MSTRKRVDVSDSDSDDGHDAKQARSSSASIRHAQHSSSEREEKAAVRPAPASASASSAAAAAAAASTPAAPASGSGTATAAAAPRRRVFTIPGVTPAVTEVKASSYITQMVRDQLAKDALRAASEKRIAAMDIEIERYKAEKEEAVAKMTSDVQHATAVNLASLQTAKTNEKTGAAAAAASSSSSAAASKQNDAAAGAESDFEQHAQLPIAQHRVGRGLAPSAYSPACLFFRRPLSFPRPLSPGAAPVGAGRIAALLSELAALFEALFVPSAHPDGSILPDMTPELCDRIQELQALVLAGKSSTVQCNKVKELMWRLCAFVKDAEVPTRAAEYLHAILHHETIAQNGVTRLPGFTARLANSDIKMLLAPEYETRERARVRSFSASSDGWVPTFADLIEVIRAYGGDLSRQDTMVVEEDDAVAMPAAPLFSPPSSAPVASLPTEDLSTCSLFDHNLQLVFGLFLVHLKAYPHSKIFRNTQERHDCVLLFLRVLLDDMTASDRRDHRAVLQEILAVVVEGMEREESEEAAGAASSAAAASSTSNAAQLSDASFNRAVQLFLSPYLSSTPLVLASVHAHLLPATHLLKQITRSAAQALATSCVRKTVLSAVPIDRSPPLSAFTSLLADAGLQSKLQSLRPTSLGSADPVQFVHTLVLLSDVCVLERVQLSKADTQLVNECLAFLTKAARQIGVNMDQDPELKALKDHCQVSSNFLGSLTKIYVHKLKQNSKLYCTGTAGAGTAAAGTANNKDNKATQSKKKQESKENDDMDDD